MLPSPQVRLARFEGTGFAQLLLPLFSDSLTRPSQLSLLLVAMGWVLSGKEHRLASYLWRSGASEVKHFSSFYTWLERSIYPLLDELWRKVIVVAASYVPEGELLVVKIDDSSRKKTGRKIEGTSYYRNGASGARQEKRSIFGLNLVVATLELPLPWWPGASLPVPMGLAVYLKARLAQRLGRPYYRRTELALQMVERLREAVPERQLQVIADGAYARRHFLPALPHHSDVISRLPIGSQLYDFPTPPPKGKRGPKPKKGALIGSAKTLVKQPGWQPHPQEKGAEILVREGLWHSVLPQVPIKVVYLRRLQTTRRRGPKRALEALFTTDLSLCAREMLKRYASRWGVEITLRDCYALYGLAQDACRKYPRIVAINSLRLIFAALEVFWFINHAKRWGPPQLLTYRPWYRQKQAPSLNDVRSASREEIFAQGIMPTCGFWPRPLVIRGHSDAGFKKAA